MNLFDEKIEKAKTICILGHQNPDGDCIGSALAIYHYIINQYNTEKKVKIYFTEFSENFFILPNADKISHDTNDAEKYDLCIVVDCGDKSRFKDFARYFDEASDSIVFDHHENNVLPTKVSVVNPKSIATCEVLYPFLNPAYIDDKVAECLFIGIATDSGVFKYQDTSSLTFEIAARLLTYDFDKTKLLDTIVFDNTVSQRKAQGLVFGRLKLLCKGKVSFSYITDDELDSFNLKKADIDNIIVYLREIKDIKVAAFAYPTGNKIFKFSLRSKDNAIDVAEFARMHDGGGHKLAAGCMYYGDIESIEKMFTNDIGLFIEGK